MLMVVVDVMLWLRKCDEEDVVTATWSASGLGLGFLIHSDLVDSSKRDRPSLDTVGSSEASCSLHLKEVKFQIHFHSRKKLAQRSSRERCCQFCGKHG